MVERMIPIVMASNDKYAPYLGVAISSMIECFSEKYVYKIHILEANISIGHKKRIKKLETKNVTIDFNDVSNLIDEFKIPTVNHLTPETTYRLLVDKLFPQYSKIIYIDCDVIVARDLGELYENDLGECILGAVRGRLFPGSVKYIKSELKIPLSGYFNAGVLLINTDRFREEQIGLRGLKMLSKKTYGTQDQDVLNLLCLNKVKYLDGRWNVEWEHLTGWSGEPVIDEQREGSLSLVNDPYIIHYTSAIKPWSHPEIELADYFWATARKTQFYEEILFQNLEKNDIFDLYTVPWSALKAHSKIILYGYGNVGRKFYGQILKTKFVKIVAVCDKRAKEISNLNVPVIEPIDLIKYDFDYILVAVEQKSVADAIRSELENQGIASNVLCWGSPFTN